MPAEFDLCVSQGGRVRTVSGPSKKHGVKSGEFVRFCVLGDRSVRGEVKTRKGTSHGSSHGEKLNNKRADLRPADHHNKGERCKLCKFFKSPTECKIIDGPVSADSVCNWIQGVEKTPKYSVKEEDWIDFVEGMKKTQPYQHIVRDGAITPEGPLVLIEDTMEPKSHYFSLSEEFHVIHTTREHHWQQSEVDLTIAAGKSEK